MSCPKNNSSCSQPTDCMDPAGSADCFNSSCNTSQKCAQLACTGQSDSYCAQFGSGFTCVNGQCSGGYRCSANSDCSNLAPYLTCNSTSGLCQSVSCANSSCPKGSKCMTLSDGTKVCANNPGLKILPGNQELFVLILVLIIIISILGLLVARYYAKKNGSHKSIIELIKNFFSVRV